jgi:hypothetical protein
MSAERDFSSPAKVTTKKIGFAPEGILTLEQGRLSFQTGTTIEFDVPLESVTDIKWPRLGLGTNVHFTIEGKRYSCDFADMVPGVGGASLGGALAGIAVGRAVANVGRAMDARELGRAWRAHLEGRAEDT